MMKLYLLNHFDLGIGQQKAGSPTEYSALLLLTIARTPLVHVVVF